MGRDGWKCGRGPDSCRPPLSFTGIILLAGLVCLSSDVARAASTDLLAKIVEVYEGKFFRLSLDLHESEPGGHPAPSLDEKGWHYNDPNRPVVLRAGEEVEVSGVFNYGEASFFLEISRKDKWKGGPARPRMRVRFTVTAPPDDPGKQEAQAHALIHRVLREIP